MHMIDMRWALSRTIEPTAKCLDVGQVKGHGGINIDTDDALIVSLIDEATSYVEHDTRRSVMEQTWQMLLPKFPKEILLPRPPIDSVTSIQYQDINNAQQTLATSVYQTDLTGLVGRVKLAYEQDWPDITSDQYDSVVVTYKTGEADAKNVDPRLIQAVRVKTLDLYDMRHIHSSMPMIENPEYRALIDQLTVPAF